jgi:hypothetical protein
VAGWPPIVSKILVLVSLSTPAHWNRASRSTCTPTRRMLQEQRLSERPRREWTRLARTRDQRRRLRQPASC